jgi:fructose-bisphosphate aldolase/2-amino-3,7-dideoxy-D-threo-hept-6-ulosonate synthase
MVSGKAVRLSRITCGGKMLCVPMDHSFTLGPIRGLESPEETVREVCEGGATAVLMHKGTAMRLRSVYPLGMIIHLNGSTSIGPSPDRKVRITSVEEALRLGADAVSVHVNIGSRDEPEMLSLLGETADTCDMYQIPLIAMMYPRGELIKEPVSPDVVAHAAWVGSEAGADIVKTVYTGSTETFREVVRKSLAPVVLAGGPKVGSDVELLRLARSAMDAGAMGVTFGRNIFQHESPRRIVRLLRKIVIDGMGVEQVLEEPV